MATYRLVRSAMKALSSACRTDAGSLRGISTALGLACGIALAGCGTTFDRAVTVSGAPSATQHAEDSAPEFEARALSGVPIAIDVENDRGGVEVRVDPSVETVTVSATIHVAEGVADAYRRPIAEQVAVSASLEWVGVGSAEAPAGAAVDVARPETAQDVDPVAANVPMSAEAAAEQSRVLPGTVRGVLVVRATSARPDSGDHSVSVLIRMPRVDGARVITSGSGDVILVGVRGALQVENGAGAIEVRTPHILDEPVALIAPRGNVWLQIPPGSAGRFELTTLQGIATLASLEQPADVYSRRDVYRGVLNGGMNPVVLKSDAGNVRVFVREDPVALTRVFK